MTDITTEPTAARRWRLALAGLMLITGTLHFAIPKPYMKLIPGWLGSPRAWVYASGVWELASGGLLLSRRTKKAGGYAAAATIAAVYPGNLKMAFDAGVPSDTAAIFAWLRLPLQIPLFAWALRQTRR